MPLRINHPRKHKPRILIAQGNCANYNNVQVTVKDSSGTPVQGGAMLPMTKLHSWGYKISLKKAKDTYNISAQEAQPGLLGLTTDSTCYTVDTWSAPQQQAPPCVAAPADGDQVGIVFYPYGTAAAAITQCEFSDGVNSVDPANGAPIQPDGNGDWSTTVDTTQAQPAAFAPNAICTLTVTDQNGNSTTINNLTIASANQTKGRKPPAKPPRKAKKKKK